METDITLKKLNQINSAEKVKKILEKQKERKKFCKTTLLFKLIQRETFPLTYDQTRPENRAEIEKIYQNTQANRSSRILSDEELTLETSAYFICTQ